MADKPHLYESYASLRLQHIVHEEQRVCSSVQLFGIVLSTCTRSKSEIESSRLQVAHHLRPGVEEQLTSIGLDTQLEPNATALDALSRSA